MPRPAARGGLHLTSGERAGRLCGLQRGGGTTSPLGGGVNAGALHRSGASRARLHALLPVGPPPPPILPPATRPTRPIEEREGAASRGSLQQQ